MSLPLSQQSFTTAQVAAALGISPQGVAKRARKHGWKKEGRTTQGGGFVWLFPSIDLKTREAIAATVNIVERVTPQQESLEMQKLVAEAKENFNRKTDKAKDKAGEKLILLFQAWRLHHDGVSLSRAFELVSERNGVSVKNLQGWYYGTPAKRGVRGIAEENWVFFLVDNYKGRVKFADCDPKAFDYLCSDYLRREAPSFSSCFRRLVQTAQRNGWVIPGKTSMWRRLDRKYALPERFFIRTGRIIGTPFQYRDRGSVRAGAGVSGDGLKFDKIYVIHPDGEVTNRTTAWFWEDIRSGKILSYEIGKTESTDIFRKSLYKLTEYFTPEWALVDNTRVAGNKCMTGQADNRHRFTSKETDPVGFLKLLGIEPKFTNPDQEMSNPGAKPIERAFGRGGIHEGVRNHPAIEGRGYSLNTAISLSEFTEILEQVVNEYNAREGRTGGICNGRCFNTVFAEDFAKRTDVCKASPELRDLLLKHQESCRVRLDGSVAIKAGRGTGKHRYWGECLSPCIGKHVAVLYDPENLAAGASILDLTGKFLGKARWLPTTAFNDKAAGEELARERARYNKSAKKVAKSSERMSALERQQLNAPIEPGDIPTPAGTITKLAPEEIQKMNRGVFGEKMSPEQRKRHMDAVFDNLEKPYEDRRLAFTGR